MFVTSNGCSSAEQLTHRVVGDPVAVGSFRLREMCFAPELFEESG
jgi:hypothetical protein